MALDQYTIDKRNKDGLQGNCNECRSLQKRQFRDKIRQGIGLVESIDKKCHLCNVTKPIDEFFKDASNSDGYARRCKECKNAQTKAWRNKNKEDYNEYMRKHREEHPQSEIQKEQNRNRVMKSRYGIDGNDYKALLDLQKDVCAICEQKSKRRLLVDHDHSNGMVRGLLCDRCNVAIAILDNPTLLQAAKKYLKII